MFGWRASGNHKPDQIPGLKMAEQFIAEYANSDKKSLYAINLWGVVTAFEKVFGDLEQFNSSGDEKKRRYITLLGTTAVEEMRNGNLPAAACHNFFMNYLIATNGLNRNELRGSIEQVSDMLDGIVRYGALQKEEIGEIEDAAKEIMSSEGQFKIGSGVIVGPVTERAVRDVSEIIIRDLSRILVTGDDYYWFTVEQYDRLLSERSAIRNMLDELSLFPIEHEGRCSSESYVGKPNPGVQYIDSIHAQVHSWCAITVPHLDPGELATRVIAASYGHFRNAYQRVLGELRLEMAKQYHADCVANNDRPSASLWSAVITALS